MWRAYPTKSLYTADHFDRYKDLIVGVVPGGDVVVWLSSLSQTIEIGRYKAAVTDKITWKDFAGMNGMASDNTKENYLKYTEKGISPLPFNILEKYERRYNWKAVVEKEDGKNKAQKINLNKLLVIYFNGEEETSYTLYKDDYNLALRPVPTKVIFEFYLDNKEFGGGFDLKVDDAFKGFEEINKSGNKSMELVVKLDVDNKVSKVILRNETEQYVFDTTDADIGFIAVDKSLLKTPLKN